jgi:hypothetical protein
MKAINYDPNYGKRKKLIERILGRVDAGRGMRRAVVSALVFSSLALGISISSLLYTDNVSVTFPVENVVQNGAMESLISYPQSDQVSQIAEKVQRRKKHIFLAGVTGYTNAARKAKFKSTDYTYTGTSEWIDESTLGFRIKFKSSGTFTPKKSVVIDLFLLGGGSGGKGGQPNYEGGGGGAGGLTGTWTSITLNANQAYAVVIGAGGGAGANGGTTSFNAAYSKAGGTLHPSYQYGGASGGSGGGSGSKGAGGSNGSNGGAGVVAGGTGQGTNTYEFGDATQTLYAGGGGAGGGQYSWQGAGGAGGAGGGAQGGYSGAGAGSSASANTGAGGGGGGSDDDSSTGAGGSGGSGICVIRNHR